MQTRARGSAQRDSCERTPYDLNAVCFPQRIVDTGAGVASTCIVETHPKLFQQKPCCAPPFSVCVSPRVNLFLPTPPRPRSTTRCSLLFIVCRRLVFSHPTMVAALKLAREVYNPLASLFGCVLAVPGNACLQQARSPPPLKCASGRTSSSCGYVFFRFFLLPMRVVLLSVDALGPSDVVPAWELIDS